MGKVKDLGDKMKLENWTWEENSILYNISDYTSTKEIFQAVCNELGRYFSLYGAKYTKSKPKLKWKGKKIRCEMGFWSSHSNIPGDWVNLEIVTSIYALDDGNMERKGILNYGPRPKNFNVYKIDRELFKQIIQYIEDTLEMVWSLEYKEGVDKYLSQCDKKKMIEENLNNMIYYNSLLDMQELAENVLWDEVGEYIGKVNEFEKMVEEIGYIDHDKVKEVNWCEVFDSSEIIVLESKEKDGKIDMQFEMPFILSAWNYKCPLFRVTACVTGKAELTKEKVVKIQGMKYSDIEVDSVYL